MHTGITSALDPKATDFHGRGVAQFPANTTCSFGTWESTCLGKGALCCHPGSRFATVPQCRYPSIHFRIFSLTNQIRDMYQKCAARHYNIKKTWGGGLPWLLFDFKHAGALLHRQHGHHDLVRSTQVLNRIGQYTDSTPL
jgi:hypothetical protein